MLLLSGLVKEDTDLFKQICIDDFLGFAYT